MSILSRGAGIDGSPLARLRNHNGEHGSLFEADSIGSGDIRMDRRNEEEHMVGPTESFK
uniref:Uncharacterized protein n=1 Tax=Moniliophthora roreri TaxID=221103 RepID=A0A0W0EWJ9_MONRR